MGKIIVTGASGFVGRACAAALREAGHDVASLRAPVLFSDQADLLRPGGRPGRPEPLARPELLARIAATLHGHDVAVNAAGLPHSASQASARLFGANSLWPHVLAQACELAEVPRLVHVSSIAVQGRIRVLDHTPRYAPVTPYAASKVLGEQLLTDAARRGATQVTIYRPPSVHDWDRDVTRSFAAFCRRWPLVVVGDGNQPVPVSLAGNVGAATAALVAAEDPPFIVLHPYEGQTVRSLYETFGPGRPIHALPEPVVRWTLRAVEPLARRIPIAAAVSRRAELLLLGQAQSESWLTISGFRPPLGAAAWHRVAQTAAARPGPSAIPDHYYPSP